MTGRITPDLKAAILARIDLVEIVSARMTLKRAGQDYVGRCPFHEEKTPSFTVSPTKQFYYCFGCGAHGNAIDFLIEYDRLHFVEAVEELAHRVGMALPDADTPATTGPDPRPLLALLEQAAMLYRRQWREHPRAAAAIAYLKERGLTGAIAERFGLGFAPPEGDFLLNRLGGNAETRERLVQAGLLAERDGRCYDRFRGRILFPIRDRRGRTLGFGGRVIGSGEPKYLNSPETPVFHKGCELYGLYEATQMRRDPPRLLVVEGYLDVIALAQFEIEYAVATLGTATTQEQLQSLHRATQETIFCFDGDAAGRKAAWKALRQTLPLANGRHTDQFLFLPEGQDPDSLVRAEGRAAFEQRLSTALPLSEFLFQELTRNLDTRGVEGRARLHEQASALLGEIPASAYRELLCQRLAELTGVAVAPVVRAPAPARPRPPTRLTPVRLAITLLLQDPALAQEAGQADECWREHANPDIPLLRALIDWLGERPDAHLAILLEHWRDSAQEPILRRLADWRLTEHIPEEGRAAEFIGALKRLSQEAQREQRWRHLRDLPAPQARD